jgi:hypothetical protein
VIVKGENKRVDECIMSPVVKLSLFILVELNVYVCVWKKSNIIPNEGARERKKRTVLENNNIIIIIILTITMKIDGVVSEKNRKKKREEKRNKGMRRCLINQTRGPVELSGSFFSRLSSTISSHHRCRPSVKENEAILFLLSS